MAPSEDISATIKMPVETDSPILVVDDDPAVVQLVARMLRHAGHHRVIGAERGLGALRLLGISDDGNQLAEADRQQISLVILDIVMPDLNGVEVCRRIKRARPDMGVILITGNDIENIHQRLIESGADDFLTKPFNPDELAARVALLLRRRSLATASEAVLGQARRSGGQRMPYIGDRIGDYVIIDTLGWGKSSIIFRAADTRTNDPVAIKMLTRYAAEFKDVVSRFHNEARIMSAIRHPHIIALHHAGEYDGCPYLVLEYFPGVDLEEYVVTRGRPDFPTFLRIARDLAGALRVIHEAGIIHRDVKLKNVLIVPLTGAIKLSDFGIALTAESPHVTQDGFIVGTPLYMAPEVFSGEPATIQSDVYAYGATLYHLLTGVPPFVAERSTDLYRKHRHLVAPPIVTYRAGVPVAWDKLIIDACLAKDAGDRPADMDAIITALDQLAEATF